MCISVRATAILPIQLILPKNPAKATLAGFSSRIGKARQDFWQDLWKDVYFKFYNTHYLKRVIA